MAKAVRTPGQLTTTIRREFLAQLVAGTKRIEYREIKPYWTRQLARVKTPFHLRLRNGYYKRVPEVTLLISRVRENTAEGLYELHVRKVLAVKHWDRRRGVPRK